MKSIPTLRPLLIALTVASLLGSTGCAWMKSKLNYEANYQASGEARPLEVPPDLDAPTRNEAMAIPSVQAGAGGAPSDAPGGVASFGGVDSFELSDDLPSAYRRLGIALQRIEGVTVTSQAQALSSYEVNYNGTTALIRAENRGGSTRISAVGADGIAITSGPAAELLGKLKARMQ